MTSNPPLLRLENVIFRWRPDVEPTLAIDHLELSTGERVFLAGPSGSGKSTLLGLIAGVLTPERGHIEILGQKLSALSASARDQFRADHIGFIFQLFNLIPYLSVRDNVTLPCLFSTRRRTHLASIGLSADDEALRLLDHLGLGDSALLARPVTELSVGQQQRVAAARALIGAPPLLIADEPTSALDTAHRQGFLDLLFRECAAQGTTLLFVSHDEGLSAQFDRRLHMAELHRAKAAA